MAKKGSDEIAIQIAKKYGDVFRTGEVVFEETKNLQVIPVSPAIDVALGGGIKEGSWVILTGDPKTGKTTTALQFASNCQKEEYGKRKVLFINAEGRLKAMNLEGVHGLNREEILVVDSSDGPMPAEDYLNIVVKYVTQQPNCVVIIDSISSLIPSKELSEDVEAQFRPGLPKILSIFTKKLANIVPKQRAIVIMINHFIANTSGMGMKRKIPDGGVKIRYQADTLMEVAYTKKWEASSGNQIGQLVHWRVGCSSAGGFPGGEAQSWLKYGHGLDYTQELINLGYEFGLISKSGSWYRCEFIEGDDGKFQGQQKLAQFLEDNPKHLNELDKKIKEML